MEIRAAGNQKGQFSCQRLQHIATRGASGEFSVAGKQGNFGQQVRRARRRAGLLEQRCLSWLGRAPSCVKFFPLIITALEPFFMLSEINLHDVTHIKMLIRRQAESLPRRRRKFRPALAVTFGGPRYFRNPLPNHGLRNNQLRLAALRFFGFSNCFENRAEIVAIRKRLHIPANRLKPGEGVFALRLSRHRVEGDVIRIVNQNQIIEPLVTRESARLHRDTFLHAAVAR